MFILLEHVFSCAPNAIRQESEAALLLRLEALEQRVFGRSRMAHHEMSDFHSKVDTLAKQLSRLEGGSRELREVAQQGKIRYNRLSLSHTSADKRSEPLNSWIA